MRAKEFTRIINEATRDEEWQGWVIRYETSPRIKGQPLRWMTYNKKRGTESAHEGQAATPQEALEAAKAWIQSGGNAKEIATNKNLTIDFNVKFVTDILNGGKDFFAKIEAGPKLTVSDTQGTGFKRSHIRTRPSSDSSQATLLPMISITGSEAKDAGLKAHGRYILGDTEKNADGSISFPLIYQSTVQAKGDIHRMTKPGLTVAMTRDDAGLEEGWESGPEEYKEPYDDADDAYDRRRQEKLDIEAEKENAKRPQEKVYTLVGRGPGMKPNYRFPGEYKSQEAAMAARERLMADPKTPHPEHIGIHSYTRYLDQPNESRGHKIIATKLKNIDLAKKFASGEVKIPTPQERRAELEKQKQNKS